jgi:hypothetical protein
MRLEQRYSVSANKEITVLITKQSIYTTVLDNSSDPLFKRLCCYALACLMPKGAPLDNFWQGVEAVSNNTSIREDKLNNVLQVGRRWRDIVAYFSDCSSKPSATGIILILKDGS